MTTLDVYLRLLLFPAIATATLIPSAGNAAVNQHHGFGDSAIKQHMTNSGGYFSQPQSNVQKLHYTARPYIIDNQVQSSK